MGNEKTKNYTDVVPYPTLLVAASEVTYTSDEHYEFEDAGLASFAIRNSTLIANYLTAGTVIVSPQISFDGGTTFLDAGTMAGYQDFQASDDVEAVAEIVTFVGSAAGGDQVSEYSGRWFALYDGTSPTVFWYDHSGAASVPAHGISGATEVSMDISGAGDTLDAIMAIVETDVGGEDAFGASYNAGTDTMVVTNATAGVSTNPNTGNMLTATAVVNSFATTTQGIDAVTGNVAYNNVVAIAPRVRVVAVANASAALTEGHGLQTDIIMTQVDYGTRKVVFPDVVSVPATAPIGFTLYSDSLVTNSLQPDQMLKVWLFAYSNDRSKITDQVRYALEASNDNVNWWVASAVGTDLANGSNQVHGVTAVVHGTTYYLGKYLRVHFYDNNNSGLLASAHLIQFNVIVEY